MRILALDIGKKRIGVAVSDPLGMTAQSLGVIPVKGWRYLMGELKKYILEYGITELLIGLPRQMSGEIGQSAREVQKIGEKIGVKLGLPVSYWDERLSTAEASKLLLSADLSRRRRREAVDKTAAAIILSGYLAFIGSGKKEAPLW
ncbi:MAG: Holliday junction resolvase RuvX [Bacillota bacterium]